MRSVFRLSIDLCLGCTNCMRHRKVHMHARVEAVKLLTKVIVEDGPADPDDHKDGQVQ